MINVHVESADAIDDAFINGLEKGAKICDAKEADRKRRSVMAAAIRKYKVNRLLAREIGFNTRIEA